ncbi:CsbD family protein [Methylocapsa palsarum]|uniref:CsbD-like n=1 Tax=Methylocapsa palsarum TaxID=1612308 RepID=A0A1I3XGM1_9HYPH|nr:CsbD family protein [Methylocapsa palsarum]SFK18714.1 CsbD-like [Methylocapsa palsarum]
MDKETVKGTMDKVKGAAKEAAGRMTGDKTLQAEGKADKAAGAARQTVGDIKDAGKKVADAIKR